MIHKLPRGLGTLSVSPEEAGSAVNSVHEGVSIKIRVKSHGKSLTTVIPASLTPEPDFVIKVPSTPSPLCLHYIEAISIRQLSNACQNRNSYPPLLAPLRLPACFRNLVCTYNIASKYAIVCSRDIR